MGENLDLSTLRLCSMLASCAYAFVFVVIGYRHPAARHFRYWIGSSGLYAALIVLFGIMPRPAGVVIDVLMYGMLTVTNVLIVMGVRTFEEQEPFRPWMALVIAGSMAMKALSAIVLAMGLPISAIASMVIDGVALSMTIGICGLAIYRGHDTPMRRIAGAAMMAYVPGYAIALAAEWAMPAAHWLAIVPLVLDQLLLAVMNQGLLAMCGDRAQQRLRDAARLDPLTQSWNRAGLQAKEATLVRAGTGVVAFDIDHFKAINDRHGHAAGDAVLVDLAKVARSLAEIWHGVVVRLGGDEFAAILPDSGMEGARSFASQLTDAVAASSRGDEQAPVSTISLGIALIAPGDTVLAPALGRADAQLYRAKRAGRTGWRHGRRGVSIRSIRARRRDPICQRSIGWPRPAERNAAGGVYQKMPYTASIT